VDRASCWPDAGFIEIEPALAGRLPFAFPEKADQSRVDLVGALLLNPVGGAFDDELLPQGWRNPLHIADAFGADQNRKDGVLRSRDEQRQLMDLRALPRRGQFPVAVDVAISVEPDQPTCALFEQEDLNSFAETEREDGIAFPPCLPDFVEGIARLYDRVA
jgi:hypothetical protein